MAQIDVDTTAQVLPVGTHLVQNLGPADLYVGRADVSAENGIQVPAGQSVVVSGGGNWVVSESACDVRYHTGASGSLTVEISE